MKYPEAKATLRPVNRWSVCLLAAVLPVGAAALALSSCGGPSVHPFEADGVPPTPLVSPEGRAAFLGSEACRECHPAEFEQHADSLHAQTLFAPQEPRVADRYRTAQVLKDPALGADYAFGVDGKTPRVSLWTAKGQEAHSSPRFILGSGKYGHTPVFERNGEFLESRTSYYPSLGRWHWTPGQQEETARREPLGRTMHRDEATSCILCHSTAVVQTETEAVAEGSLFNVGCERCHGPGREHVEAARRGRKGGGLYTYREAAGSTIAALCSACHRTPAESAAVNLESKRDLPRFAGTALAASRCYQLSQGRLTCTTCHNPHTRVATDPTSYERVCLGCHSSGKEAQTRCPVNPKDGCIPCHMPAQSVDFPGGARFHNHWIKPYSESLRAAFARKSAPAAARDPIERGG